MDASNFQTKTLKSIRFKDEPEDVEDNTNGEADVEDDKIEADEDEDEEETGVEILEGPRDITVLKGQSATFTATFTGNPKPVVSWLKKVSVGRDSSGLCSVWAVRRHLSHRPKNLCLTMYMFVS